jgi:hypothetical protein
MYVNTSFDAVHTSFGLLPCCGHVLLLTNTTYLWYDTSSVSLPACSPPSNTPVLSFPHHRPLVSNPLLPSMSATPVDPSDGMALSSAAVNTTDGIAPLPLVSPPDLNHVHGLLQDKVSARTDSDSTNRTTTGPATAGSSASTSIPDIISTSQSVPASNAFPTSTFAPDIPDYGTVLVPDSDGPSAQPPAHKRKKPTAKPAAKARATTRPTPDVDDDNDDGPSGPGRKPAFNKTVLALIRTPERLKNHASISAIRDMNTQKSVRSTFLDGIALLLGDMVNYKWDSVKYGGNEKDKWEVAKPLKTLTTAEQASEKPKRDAFVKKIKGVQLISSVSCRSYSDFPCRRSVRPSHRRSRRRRRLSDASMTPSGQPSTKLLVLRRRPSTPSCSI